MNFVLEKKYSYSLVVHKNESKSEKAKYNNYILYASSVCCNIKHLLIIVGYCFCDVVILAARFFSAVLSCDCALNER